VKGLGQLFEFEARVRAIREDVQQLKDDTRFLGAESNDLTYALAISTAIQARVTFVSRHKLLAKKWQACRNTFAI
jgi:hypothetical protein